MIEIWTYDYSKDIDLPIRSDYIKPNKDRPDRNEIDTFQDYELTQCIVYELAIRNPRYKEEVDYVIEFYNEHKKDIDFSIINRGKPIERKKGQHITHSKFLELKRLINNIEVIPFNFEDNTLEYKDIKRFDEEFYKLLDFIMEHQSKKGIESTIFKKKKKLIDKTDILEEEGFWVETKIESVNQPVFYIPVDPDYTSKAAVKAAKTPEDFFEITKKYNKDTTSDKVAERLKRRDVLISKMRIHERFKRPKLKFNSSTLKHLIAEIDLSRPEKEIYAYIKHLKGALRDNSELITPMELLASLFEPEDEVFIDNEKKYNVSKASMFAERLFVYDYITTTIKNNKANNSFYEKQIRKIQDASKDDFCLNRTEKTQEAKAYFAENEATTSARKLMKKPEILKAIGAKSDTVIGHYNKINELLIDERYKKLLSDI